MYESCPGHSLKERDFNKRRFEPEIYQNYKSQPIVHREVYDAWSLLECANARPCKGCGRRPVHWGHLVITVAAGRIQQGGREAISTYFHTNNYRYNYSETVDGPQEDTPNADLLAGYRALRTVQQLKDLNDPARCNERLTDEEGSPEVYLAKVVIRSSSDYLVLGMGSDVLRWDSAGFQQTTEPTESDLYVFKIMEEEIFALNCRGIHVQFWLSSQHAIGPAERLITDKLQGIGAMQAT